MSKSSSFKVLITSPKGGVGKSTISANLSAFLQSQGQTVTLLDFDHHGSSSHWLLRAPNLGVVIQHKPLPLDQGTNRSLLEARMHYVFSRQRFPVRFILPPPIIESQSARRHIQNPIVGF